MRHTDGFDAKDYTGSRHRLRLLTECSIGNAVLSYQLIYKRSDDISGRLTYFLK